MEFRRQLRAITFDMGDTLVEIRPAIHERAHEVLQEHGLSCTVGAVREALSRAWLCLGEEYMASSRPLQPARFFGAWLKELGVRENFEGLAAQVGKSLTSIEYTRCLPEEVPSILAQLRQRGYLLGIISNWSPTLEAYCEELGVANYFACILASEAVGVAKPGPRIFEMALERLAVAPAEALHVGDNYYADVLGARRAGMQGILLDRHGLFPHADCHRLQELGELLGLL